MTNDPAKFTVIGERKDNSFKNGIDEQKAAYRQASLHSDYNQMARALENLYCEIRPKVRYDQEKKIEMVDGVIEWYYTLSEQYKQATPGGKYTIKFPPDILNKIRTKFRDAYLCLNNQLASMRLL